MVRLYRFLAFLLVPLRLVLIIIYVIFLCAKSTSKYSLQNEGSVVLFGACRLWRGITNHIEYNKDKLSYSIYRVNKGLEPDVDTPDGVEIIEATSNKFWRDFKSVKFFFEKRGSSFEMYFHENIFEILILTLIVKLNTGHLVAVCTGAEVLHYTKRHIIIRLATRILFLCANKVVYKEPYMPSILLKNRLVSQKRLISVSNGVSDTGSVVQKPSIFQILFLNSFKSWRNISVLIDALSMLKDRNIFLQCKIVGARTEDEFDEVDGLVRANGLQSNVSVEYFSTDPFSFYRNATVFVLAADHVYANNALLEAMAMECVPVISDAPLSELIVPSEDVGFRVPLGDTGRLATVLETLYRDAALVKRCQSNARQHVLREFSEKNRAEIMLRAHHE